MRQKIDVLLVFLLLGAGCESQGPGETSTEASDEGFSIRCMQGDDEAASIGSFVITVSSDGRAIAEATGVRDGSIEGCWMTDIDADDRTEVLLFTRSAGSGGYGQLHTYEFAGDDLQPSELPDPDAALMEGYQGCDTYDIREGRLVRKFPIFLEDDANCCPEGGERTIEFDGANAAWRLSGVN